MWFESREDDLGGRGWVEIKEELDGKVWREMVVRVVCVWAFDLGSGEREERARDECGVEGDAEHLDACGLYGCGGLFGFCVRVVVPFDEDVACEDSVDCKHQSGGGGGGGGSGRKERDDPVCLHSPLRRIEELGWMRVARVDVDDRPATWRGGGGGGV